jgi:hypothetical protein
VPIMFGGLGLRHEIISRPVLTVDVAATLAARTRTKFPSGSVGAPLAEIVPRGKE